MLQQKLAGILQDLTDGGINGVNGDGYEPRSPDGMNGYDNGFRTPYGEPNGGQTGAWQGGTTPYGQGNATPYGATPYGGGNGWN